MAGRLAADGRIRAAAWSIRRRFIAAGKLSWQVPPGRWKIILFQPRFLPRPLGQGGQFSVDGASKDCVDWFVALRSIRGMMLISGPRIRKRTTVGFFYDEPEPRWRSGYRTSRRAQTSGRSIGRRPSSLINSELAGDDQAAGSLSVSGRPLPRRGAAPCTAESSEWCHVHVVSRWAISWNTARSYGEPGIPVPAI